MRRFLKGIWFVGVIAMVWGCSLGEETIQFKCDRDPDETLFENPPLDTAFVKIESSNPALVRTINGIRLDTPEGYPVDGEYQNLSVFEREPKPENGRLFGLGTQITAESDSVDVVISFNFATGNQIAEVCRSTKVFQREHDWSRWDENIVGAEVMVTIPEDGKLVTYSSDTDQNDKDLFYLDGARFLDEVGFYAILSGNFSVLLVELNTGEATPREVEISGSFVLDMRVSK